MNIPTAPEQVTIRYRDSSPGEDRITLRFPDPEAHARALDASVSALGWLEELDRLEDEYDGFAAVEVELEDLVDYGVKAIAFIDDDDEVMPVSVRDCEVVESWFPAHG